MSFILARSPSPPEPEEDTLTAAFHAAFQSFTGGGPSQQSNQPSFIPYDHDMGLPKGERHQDSLEVVVSSDTLYLRGTGVDVNPALLSGNIVLHLHEATSLKQITLHFKGKAKIPAAANESISIQSNQLTYLVCNHEWSFLEGAKGHSHTLKAGRHVFPFQLHLGGSLPSSISTTAFGGASVQYSLIATAARAGFSFTQRDIQTICPINIVRTFGSEALEYQQTLEIENTWPEKLMYSIMVPHKAWAAGEQVTAVVKFSPLVKGARVLNVTTTVNETVKLYGRLASQECTRAIVTSRHDIIDGHAVLSSEQHHRYRIPLLGGTQPSSSRPSAPASPSIAQLSPGQSATGATSYFPPASPSHTPGYMTPLTTTTTNSSSSSDANRVVTSPPLTSASSSQPASENHASGTASPSELEEEEPSSDVITTLHITIPASATPTHALEPIQISHRIRWSILIGNRDGHTSELRCSLPLHVLDHRLIDEARAATLATRRLLLGLQDVDGGMGIGSNGETSDNEDDMELPSYPAHVRDRVANAFLPDTGVMRVTNPWIAQGVSPVLGMWSETSSGLQSPAPLEAHPISSHGSNPRSQLPAVPPPPGANQQLDWVNSELLLSLTERVERPGQPSSSTSGPARITPPESATSAHASRLPSRRGSRANSRAPSPERSTSRDAGSLQPGVLAHGSGVHGPHGNGGDTFVHSSSTASRNMSGLFHISMKPFSSFSLSSRNSSHTNLQGNFPHGHSHLATHASGISSNAELRNRGGGGGGNGSPHSEPTSAYISPSSSSLFITPISTTARPTTQDPHSGPMLLHRAFTETPDYELASRGFLGGGVPPLDSMRGLPSYEDAERERSRSGSETDLVAHHCRNQDSRDSWGMVPSSSSPLPSLMSEALEASVRTVSSASQR